MVCLILRRMQRTNVSHPCALDRHYPAAVRAVDRPGHSDPPFPNRNVRTNYTYDRVRLP